MSELSFDKEIEQIILTYESFSKKFGIFQSIQLTSSDTHWCKETIIEVCKLSVTIEDFENWRKRNE